ncbi:hypothetical protein KC968_00175 [Candidatus Saccharibacteria bacterium]|nr:hypothetical protein [Candidatus Saccharibacteria bacterium]
MSKNEAITNIDTKKPIKPSTLRKAALALVGAGVLVAGCVDQSDKEIAKPMPAEATSNIPKKTNDGKVPGPINEPGSPDNASLAPEIGSAAMVEMATTPEQNAEFQMSATTLATSIVDLYNQGIGSKNFIHTDEQSGRQYLNVINNATDNSGYYVLVVGLPAHSLNPSEATSVHVSMVQGEVDDNRTVDVDGDGNVDNRQALYSLRLQNSDNGWMMSTEVDPSVDTSGLDPNASTVSQQTSFAKQLVLRAADGAPVA